MTALLADLHGPQKMLQDAYNNLEIKVSSSASDDELNATAEALRLACNTYNGTAACLKKFTNVKPQGAAKRRAKNA